tara:strand:+ start:3114 stop:3698 length:585 start_codon:yes stop_codon:yes gene_type:complete
MTKQVSPEAFFDSLSIAHKLDKYLDGFRLEEIHLFSYFASLLFLYKGNLIADWQHRYTVKSGYPFSDSIQEAINRHITNGLFEESEDFFIITGRGTEEFLRFKKLSTLATREEYLNAACTTSILIPYSEAIRGLLNEPELKKAEVLENKSWLEQKDIYPKFKKLSVEVGIHSEDLLLPAVSWVNYLSEIEKQKD